MKTLKYIIALSLIPIVTSCYKTIGIEPGEGLEDWTFDTHSGDATPNYSIVFPQKKVNRLDIVIDPDDWQTMTDDLDDIMAGSGGGPGPGGGFSDETPVYVPCDIFFEGRQWYYVGIRFKGNSSLNSSYQQGIEKYPLRLDFNKFEDEHPEIWDQAFYGFNEISMANNFKDQSLMREKVADDLLRDFGIPTAQAAYYRVYVDHGDGPEYWGVYTMVEVVFDTMLESWFGSDDGNCYKPDGDPASFESGSFATSGFEKKTNEEAGDWSDVQSLYNTLHSSTRISNPSAWRSDLESQFDVDGFLKWLAANTTMQNWDTYGRMTHNYYLYHDPADDMIKWIAWDNNESFSDGVGGPNTALSFEMTEIGNEWPLITYLLNDANYLTSYDQYIQDFIDGPFSVSNMTTIYQDHYNLLYDYAVGAEGEQSPFTFLSGASGFSNAQTELINHVSDRNDDADTYLGN